MLTIDLRGRLVRFGSARGGLAFRGQWLEFYTALALLLDSPGSFLTADELHRIGRWATKDANSVGKEVSRHLADLRACSSKRRSQLVEHNGATKAWRLTVPRHGVQWQPSKQFCQEWIEERRWATSNGQSIISLGAWLSGVAHVFLYAHSGRLRDAFEVARRTKGDAGSAQLLVAVSTLLEARLASRLGQDVPQAEAIDRLEGPLGSALRSRFLAASRFRPASEAETADLLPVLDEELRNLRSAADIDGLAVTHNTLGVLRRRLGLFEKAVSHFTEAAALHAATGNVASFQAVLFNIGHALYQSSEDDASRGLALSLIELDRELHRVLGLGGDSAQAEVVAAVIALHIGDMARAEMWLQRARIVLGDQGSPYDRGCATRLEAQLRWSRAIQDGTKMSVRHDVLALLKSAEALFDKAGVPVPQLRDDVRAVQRGEAIEIGSTARTFRIRAAERRALVTAPPAQ